MGLVRTEVTIKGLLKSEVGDGMADLRAEFAHRPRLINPIMAWEGDLFVVTIDSEGRDPRISGLATFDEVWDCIIACLPCSTDLHFEVRRSTFVKQTSEDDAN